MTLCLSAANPSLRTSHPRSYALVLLRLMFRTTLTLATPLCYGTTLALLTHLVLLFWVFRTTLTLATPLCYGTILALLLSLFRTRLLIKRTPGMLRVATPLCYGTTLAP